MSEKVSRVIVGCMSGVVSAVSMDLLRGYMSGAHVAVRAIVAGVIGYLAFTALSAMMNGRKAAPSEKK